MLGYFSGTNTAPLALSFPGRIHSVVFEQGPFAFDNFTFDGLVVVPEPATLSLILIAALSLARWRRLRL